jgi:hypothetical protein
LTDVLQCPYCDLRFSTRSELEQHKSLDHPRSGEEEASPTSPAPEAATPEERHAPESRKRGFWDRLLRRG